MRRLLPFLCLSAAVHAAALTGFALVLPPRSGIAGASEGDPDRVFVTVVSDQDQTPVAPVPSPLDSPESKDSKSQEFVETPEVTEPEPPNAINPDFQITDQEQKEERREKSSASTPQTASAARIRLSALGKDVHDFQSKLLAAIRQSAFFPHEALKDKQHGLVTIAFIINRDGALSSLRVVASSGSEVLDGAAREIILKASKIFPTFPPSVREESLHYTVPINFKARRSPRSSAAMLTRPDNSSPASLAPR